MLVIYRHWKQALPADVGERSRRPQHLDPQEWSRDARSPPDDLSFARYRFSPPQVSQGQRRRRSGKL